MTLEWQNDIVEQLIKEDPEATIFDFMVVKKEVEAVEESTERLSDVKNIMHGSKVYHSAVVKIEINATRKYRLKNRIIFK